MRLDRAILKNVDLEARKLPDWEEAPKESFDTSISETQVEESRIKCLGDKPGWNVIQSPREMEMNHRRVVVEFIKDLDLARRLAASHPTNTLEEECAKAIDLYLGNACKAGFVDAGFEYPCPTH